LPALPTFPTRRSSDLRTLGHEDAIFILYDKIVEIAVSASFALNLLGQLTHHALLQGSTLITKDAGEAHRTFRLTYHSPKIHYSLDRKSTRLNSSHVKI